MKCVHVQFEKKYEQFYSAFEINDARIFKNRFFCSIKFLKHKNMMRSLRLFWVPTCTRKQEKTGNVFSSS